MTTFFINTDWGTTHLRLRLVEATGTEIVTEIATDDGVAALATGNIVPEPAQRFRAVLESALDGLGDVLPGNATPPPILISGMASSSIGWQELPYAYVPWSLDGCNVVWRELEPVQSPTGRHRVILLSGVRTENDVLRGEETQLLGLFQLPMFRSLSERCTVVLPGTHSKHLHVAGAALRDFRTFMTGELFDVLGSYSILRHSIAVGRLDAFRPENHDAFLAAVRSAAELPVTSALFRVRTGQLLHGMSPDGCRAQLSGILIGSELATLCNADHRDGPIVLCADAPLDEAYQRAAIELDLRDQLRTVSAADIGRLSALGQACVARHLKLI